jgi:hypothetical protein
MDDELHTGTGVFFIGIVAGSQTQFSREPVLPAFSGIVAPSSPFQWVKNRVCSRCPGGIDKAALNRLLKNARLLRFPHPAPFNVPKSTPHGSGFRGPCIRTFLNSL